MYSIYVYSIITMNHFCSSIHVLDGNDMNFGGFIGITDEQFNVILQTPGLADALKRYICNLLNCQKYTC